MFVPAVAPPPVVAPPAPAAPPAAAPGEGRGPIARPAPVALPAPRPVVAFEPVSPPPEFKDIPPKAIRRQQISGGLWPIYQARVVPAHVCRYLCSRAHVFPHLGFRVADPGQRSGQQLGGVPTPFTSFEATAAEFLVLQETMQANAPHTWEHLPLQGWDADILLHLDTNHASCTICDLSRRHKPSRFELKDLAAHGSTTNHLLALSIFFDGRPRLRENHTNAIVARQTTAAVRQLCLRLDINLRKALCLMNVAKNDDIVQDIVDMPYTDTTRMFAEQCTKIALGLHDTLDQRQDLRRLFIDRQVDAAKESLLAIASVGARLDPDEVTPTACVLHASHLLECTQEHAHGAPRTSMAGCSYPCTHRCPALTKWPDFAFSPTRRSTALADRRRHLLAPLLRPQATMGTTVRSAMPTAAPAIARTSAGATTTRARSSTTTTARLVPRPWP
jgi:hypothetical protein